MIPRDLVLFRQISSLRGATDRPLSSKQSISTSEVHDDSKSISTEFSARVLVFMDTAQETKVEAMA